MNPVPTGDALDPVGLAGQASECALDRRFFLVNRAIDDAFDLVTQILEDPFGRVEFRRVGRLLNALNVNGVVGRASMASGSVPDDTLDTVVGPRLDNRSDGNAFHVLGPVPEQVACHAIDRQIEIGPGIGVLPQLHNLDASGRPDPPDRADEANSHFIRPVDALVLADAGCFQGVGEPPFFQASCSAADALGLPGRGTLCRNCKRLNT